MMLESLEAILSGPSVSAPNKIIDIRFTWPISIISLLSAYKLACDITAVHEGAAYVFYNYL